jgi:hypothetical protein
METWRWVIARPRIPARQSFLMSLTGQFKLPGDSEATNQKMQMEGTPDLSEDDNASPNLHPFYPHIS